MENDTMDKIVSLAKRRGFVFQGSEIYGGLKGTWDLGPLGVALNNHIKREWWKMFVEDREDMYGLDAAILMNEKVWEASGHTGAGFSDVLVTCKKCGTKHRLDKMAEQITGENMELFFYKYMIPWLEDFSSKLDKRNFELKIKLEELNKSVAEAKLDLLKNGVDPDKIVSKDNKKEIVYSAAKDHDHHLESKVLDDIKNGGPIALLKFLVKSGKLPCTECNSVLFEEPVDFNLMFVTKIGPDGNQNTYLRPETAQGIFVNFKNVLDSMAPKLPFGIAQIGKAFRNEIAPREFLFRVREFEQMEIEYFVKEGEWQERFELLRQDIWKWFDHLGLKRENVQEYDVPENDLAHYSKRTIDFEYNYPGKGFDELAGFAYRTDHDLKSHMNASGVSLEYTEPDGSGRFIPHVLEPSFGVGRALTAVLCEAYTEDEMNGEVRTFLKLPAHLAPYRVAVSPLLKNKPELVSKAREVFLMLKKQFGNVAWDDNGNIGKRYRRQDEIGTPHCIVIDFETLGEEKPELKDTVTVRDRDTGAQERVAITELAAYLTK